MSTENGARNPNINHNEKPREVRLGLEGIGGTTKPKDPVNLDEVNKMTRTSVLNGVQFTGHDDNDSRRSRSVKPTNYAARKTVAQGMMDIALLTSNANQLKSLIEYQSHVKTYLFVMVLICVSLVLQITVGVTLIFKGRFDSKFKDKAAAARVNKYIMTAVFLITVINIFIAVFSTGGNSPGNIPSTAIDATRNNS
ncbi:ninjurin-B-like [Neodiprion pinetum]|uniref:ninjurin-B-like n=1 Tax=Neodiprion pinetum TaxID=441929 RepID=UPI001EE0E9F1|nr:ninjurin-B-like [Neodiprion pinetum]XP_046473375.1 ninjurin-B-like [Neodiprion pinetum]XP_046473376.1 ninjurin-B-like [Neodiprion pinetum]XP_046473377.1 ninjurin-B-like [Neodiprion pinetum]XP_046473378.1 ninjurin-B-like [Neodiprion pinetum]